jgi:hypothetical protein
MRYGLDLESRIARLERKLFNEAKQVGTLYHICDAKAYIKYVLPKDQLQASGNYDNFLHGGDNTYISFTRNKNYTLEHDLGDYSGVFIRLVIDGDRLSDRYKIGPYNDAAFDRDTGEFGDYGSDMDDIPSQREQEEVVKGPIRNISKYIKEVQLDVSDLTDSTMRAFKSVATKLKNTGVVYYNFMKRQQSNAVRKALQAVGLSNGDSLAETAVALKNALKLNPEPLLFSKDYDKVKKAIDAGADLDAEYDRGFPLKFYCFWGDYDIVKLLIDNGANVNIKKEPPILAAAEKGDIRIVNLLIKNGADVNATNEDGSTALFYADDADVARALINAGADVNAVNNYGVTAAKKHRNWM